MIGLIVLALFLGVFLAFAWWTDRRHRGPREPGNASDFNPSNVRDQAEWDGLWKGESPMRFRKNTDPPPQY